MRPFKLLLVATLQCDATVEQKLYNFWKKCAFPQKLDFFYLSNTVRSFVCKDDAGLLNCKIKKYILFASLNLPKLSITLQ